VLIDSSWRPAADTDCHAAGREVKIVPLTGASTWHNLRVPRDMAPAEAGTAGSADEREDAPGASELQAAPASCDPERVEDDGSVRAHERPSIATLHQPQGHDPNSGSRA